MIDFIDQLTGWIASAPALAYLAIVGVLLATGVGAPIAEEVVVVSAGVLVHRQYLDGVPAWLACYLGVALSDVVMTAIGRYFGTAVLHRRWLKRMLHPRRLLWAKHQVQEHGTWGVVVARFVPGTRTATLLISGMMEVSWTRFLIADGIAAAAAVTFQFFAGYYLSKLSSRLSDLEGVSWMVMLGLASVGLVLLVGYVVWTWRRSKGLSRTRRRARRRPRRELDRPAERGDVRA